MEEASAIIGQLAEYSKKPNSEVKKLVEQKKRKFSGLLTESGAAYMVAKDLGIDLSLRQGRQRQSIAQLQDGMQNVDLLARVMHVFSPKSFERNGKSGTLCNLIVADKTGETRLTLWHNDVRKLQENNIGRGSTLLLHNCYVKSFNGKPQLNLSYAGSMTVNPEEAAGVELPKVEARECKLSELREGMGDVSTVVRVLRLFPTNEFERDGGKGRVMNFLVADDSATIRATAWNELVDAAGKLHENDLVKVEGAYTKQGLQGVELHLGWKARIVANPKTSVEIPDAMRLLHESAESRGIKQLKADQAMVAMQASIVEVNQGMLRYSVCPKCGRKVQRLDEGFVCDRCGEAKEPDIRAVLSVRLDDGTGQINAVAYGGSAELLMGLGKEELQRRLSSGSAEDIIQQLRQKLVGRKVSAVGRAKENAFSNELEFIVRSIEFS